MNRAARQKYLDEIYALDNQRSRRRRSTTEVIVICTIWGVILGVSVLILVGSVMLTVAVVRQFWA
jgi:ABC-type lipoprotein release transport system permease subunit